MKKVLTSGERMSRIFPDKGVRERFCADLRASVQGDFEEALERFLLVYDLSCQPRIVAKTEWLYKEFLNRIISWYYTPIYLAIIII